MKKIEINEQSPKQLVCTYGTLRAGQGNYSYRIAPYEKTGGAKLLGTFKTEPKFTLYGKNSGFPVLTPKGNTEVEYDLFEISDKNCLQGLHNLEGFNGIIGHPNNHFYDAMEIETPHGTAIVYIQNNVNRNDIIESGNWLNRK